tara:strand:+ start:462 stop:644 length:183 start_codon:yes stop_codon:yes gene_type:complete
MEYTIEELKEMLVLMDEQLDRQGRIVDDQLLTKRKRMAGYIEELEQSEANAQLLMGADQL